MSRTLFLTAFLTAMLIGTLGLPSGVQRVEASQTIYIRADGNIDPPTAPMQRNGNVYTLTGNITSDADGIVVERDDIVIDGAGYTIMGGGYGNGTTLVDRSNVTVRNMTIKDFSVGIHLYSTSDSIMSNNNITNTSWDPAIMLYSSSNNIIIGNNITANAGSGIQLRYSSRNSMRANSVAANSGYGIELSLSDNNDVTENTIIENRDGGILLSYSDNSTVNANTIAYCGSELSKSKGRGISLVGSSNNTLHSNTVEGNTGGIEFENSRHNTLRDNHLAENEYNFGVYGSEPVSNPYDEVRLSDFAQDIDTSNTVNGKPVYFLVDQRDLFIDSRSMGYLALVNCVNVHVKNVSLTDNGQGVLMAFTSKSTIENITVANNEAGVYLLNSDTNLITASNITNNDYGITLYRSSFNNVTRNSLTNNRGGSATQLHGCVLIGSLVLSWSVASFWRTDRSDGNTICDNLVANSSEGIFLSNPGTAHTTIINNTISTNTEGIHIERGASNNTIDHNNFIDNGHQLYIGSIVWDNGFEGNYWSDHNPVDVDKNKTGDLPYVIPYQHGFIPIRYFVIDMHPLIYPIECYESGHVCSPDLNRDGIVNNIDVGRVASAFSCKPGDSKWNPTADLDLNELINIEDVSMVAKNFGKTV